MRAIVDNLVSDIQALAASMSVATRFLRPTPWHSLRSCRGASANGALSYFAVGGSREKVISRAGECGFRPRDAGGAHIGMDRSASTRRDLVDRRVEITGPLEPKMAFNPTVGAFVDFGPYFLHSARELPDRGSGRYFYLPKTESHPEARLWNVLTSFSRIVRESR